MILISSLEDLTNEHLPLQIGTLQDVDDHSRTLQSDIFSWSRIFEYMESRSTEPRDRTETIIQWVDDSAPDQRITYHRLLKVPRHENFKSLFIHHEIYRDWEASPGRLLMVFGSPGSGKTVLATVLIQHLTEYCAVKKDSATLYVFCKDLVKAEVSGNGLLQSLIFQLLSQSQDGVPSLEEHFANSQLENRPSSLDFLMAKIRSLFKDVYIVIDDLNACLSIKGLPYILQGLFHWCKVSPVLHILMTSRSNQKLGIKTFGLNPDMLSFTMRETFVQNEIAAYISDRLWIDPALALWRDEPNVRSEIEERLIGGGNGT